MALPEQTQFLRRLLAGTALFGVVLVTHLALQKAGGFEEGCLGLGADLTTAAGATGTTAGCAAVTESAYADFLGVSNIALGLLFYVLVAGLRLGYAVVRDDRLRLASFGVVSVGLAYTVYLVYLQAAVIGSFCPLCMTSAAVVLFLFLLHLLEHMRLKSAPPVVADDSPRRRRRAAAEATPMGALRPYATILGGFVVLLLGAFAIAPEAADDADLDALAGPVGPTSIGQMTGACEYDPEYGPIADMAALTTGPSQGFGPVPVVKVFDPNCPHCRALSETLDEVIADNGSEATFYYVPYPLRQQSLGQVVALTVAQDQGLFFELMHEMFRRQDASWGMTLDELTETVNAVGMDGAALAAMLDDEARLQPVLARIQAQADAVVAAFAKEDGGLSVPKLAVGNRVVAPSYASYSPRCLDQFIAEGGVPTDVAAPDAVEVQ